MKINYNYNYYYYSETGSILILK